MAVRISERIAKEGNVVIPSKMRKRVFTACDLENCDQDKMYNLSKDGFHETLISATNHFSHNNLGEA